MCWEARRQKRRADMLINIWTWNCYCVDHGIPQNLSVILYNLIFVLSIEAAVCMFVILLPMNVVSLEGISLGSQFSSLYYF
jgi:hypothetical protein